MPYNRQTIPDAPMPVSMLPRATTLTKNDLLYLVQPGNNPGEKSRSLTLEGLADSDVFRLQGVRNAITKSNILDFTGALAETSAGAFTEVCHLDINPLLDVEFHVWGTSVKAGDSGDLSSIATKKFSRLEFRYLNGITGDLADVPADVAAALTQNLELLGCANLTVTASQLGKYVNATAITMTTNGVVYSDVADALYANGKVSGTVSIRDSADTHVCTFTSSGWTVAT